MFNLNAFNIFKKNEAEGQQPAASGQPEAEGAAGNSQNGAGAGFFQSINPSKLLDTVSSKKNGLLGDLSSKFDQITKLVSNNGEEDKPPGPPPRPKRRPKQPKPKKEKKEGEDDSSASEYGDDGDKPIYEDQIGDLAQPKATCGSTDSLDEYSKQVKTKMIDFVKHILDVKYEVSAAEKKQFLECAKDSVGQQVFCEELQQSNQSFVTEPVFLRLVECFAYVLKESHEAEDYLSARLLMNICFTIYYENALKKKVFLYEAVRTQPIWQSLRFWNAAFYDALRYERAKRPPRVPKTDEAASLERDREEQEMITFNLLSSFTNSMRTFGITKDTCLDFIKKQAHEAALGAEKVRILRNNMINWTEKQ